MNSAKEGYFLNNPPRHLSKYLIPWRHPIPLHCDGHSNGLNVIFSVRDRENDRFEVFGFLAKSQKTKNFISPIYIKNVFSENHVLVIDTSRHGYNGVQGDSSTLTGSGQPTQYTCSECGNNRFTLLVRLEYPEDILEEEASIMGFEGQENELFSWFTIISRCISCDTSKICADFECA